MVSKALRPLAEARRSSEGFDRARSQEDLSTMRLEGPIQYRKSGLQEVSI